MTVGVAHVLSGTASDPDGDPLTYSWAVVAGPAGSTLTNATTLTPSFTANAAGTYTLRLTATDNGSLSGSDNVVLSTTQPCPDGERRCGQQRLRWAPRTRSRVRLPIRTAIR